MTCFKQELKVTIKHFHLTFLTAKMAKSLYNARVVVFGFIISKRSLKVGSWIDIPVFYLIGNLVIRLRDIYIMERRYRYIRKWWLFLFELLAAIGHGSTWKVREHRQIRALATMGGICIYFTLGRAPTLQVHEWCSFQFCIFWEAKVTTVYLLQQMRT